MSLVFEVVIGYLNFPILGCWACGREKTNLLRHRQPVGLRGPEVMELQLFLCEQRNCSQWNEMEELCCLESSGHIDLWIDKVLWVGF